MPSIQLAGLSELNPPARVRTKLSRPDNRAKSLSFRSAMAGLQAPLSTLRLAPRDALRMTRGQSGLLLLFGRGFSPFHFAPSYFRTLFSNDVLWSSVARGQLNMGARLTAPFLTNS